MSQATLQFHAELNDFLSRERRGAAFAHSFRGRVSIKDMIESLGVPHTEVAAIVVHGTSRDFAYLVREGDRIDVYPISLTESLGPYLPLRPPIASPARFILDTHLGQLASYLRLLGFDTLYRNDYADAELARIASDEQRILLTRDRGLLKRRILIHAYYIRETNPQRQVAEVLRRYQLAGAIKPLRRCIRCNGLLHAVPKAQIDDRLEPKTREHYHEFRICASCGQIYWRGSHYEKIQRFIDRVLPGERPSDRAPGE
jgi:uncharacterized protein with PIN domain